MNIEIKVTDERDGIKSVETIEVGLDVLAKMDKDTFYCIYTSLLERNERNRERLLKNKDEGLLVASFIEPVLNKSK